MDIYRKNKEFVVEKKIIDVPLGCKNSVLKVITENSSEGLTQGQIYKKLHSYAASTIRNYMTELKNDGLLSITTCQCGHASIYRVLK